MYNILLLYNDIMYHAMNKDALPDNIPRWRLIVYRLLFQIWNCEYSIIIIRYSIIIIQYSTVQYYYHTVQYSITIIQYSIIIIQEYIYYSNSSNQRFKNITIMIIFCYCTQPHLIIVFLFCYQV